MAVKPRVSTHSNSKSVGSIAKQQTICATWHTSEIKTIEQARDREVTVSATGSSGDRATMPRILNALLGTKFKVINGYGTTESMLAVERGEVDGMCGVSWSTLKVSNPDWVNKKLLNVMLQAGTKPQAGLPDVPLVIDRVANAEDRKLVELLFFPQDMGRPFVMPPATPKELVATIRHAFDDTMKDPAFLAEAEKGMLDVDPVSGEEMEQILQRIYATPKALIQRAAEFNGSGGQCRDFDPHTISGSSRSSRPKPLRGSRTCSRFMISQAGAILACTTGTCKSCSSVSTMLSVCHAPP